MSEKTSKAPRPIRLKKAVTATILLVSCGVSWWIWEENDAAQTYIGLRVPSETLDFGEVLENPAFIWKLPVINDSTKAIEVSGFDISCGCLSIAPKEITLAPGDRSTLTLTLNLNTRDEKAPKGPSQVSVRIVPRTTNNALPHHGWEVTGKVRQVLAYTAPIIEMDNDCVGNKAAPSKVIPIDSFVKLERCTATCDAAMGHVTIAQGSDDKKRFTMTITPKKGLPVGRFKIDVDIHAVTSSDHERVDRRISIKGRVVDEIRFAPAVVRFGAMEMGRVADAVLTLQAKDGQIVERFQCSGKGLSLDPSAANPATSRTFAVKQRIANVGSNTNEIWFWVRDVGTVESRKITVPVYYYGSDDRGVRGFEQ